MIHAELMNVLICGDKCVSVLIDYIYVFGVSSF